MSQLFPRDEADRLVNAAFPKGTAAIDALVADPEGWAALVASVYYGLCDVWDLVETHNAPTYALCREIGDGLDHRELEYFLADQTEQVIAEAKHRLPWLDRALDTLRFRTEKRVERSQEDIRAMGTAFVVFSRPEPRTWCRDLATQLFRECLRGATVGGGATPTARVTAARVAAAIPRLITPATRNAIHRAMVDGKFIWYGNLGEHAFLTRHYDIEGAVAYDNRHETPAVDTWKYRDPDRDPWPGAFDGIFDDPRFGVLPGTDEQFLRFLRLTLHPRTREDTADARRWCATFNTYLAVDGFELVEVDLFFGKPVFSSRRLGVPTAPAGAAREAALSARASTESPPGLHAGVVPRENRGQPFERTQPDHVEAPTGTTHSSAGIKPTGGDGVGDASDQAGTLNGDTAVGVSSRAAPPPLPPAHWNPATFEADAGGATKFSISLHVTATEITDPPPGWAIAPATLNGWKKKREHEKRSPLARLGTTVRGVQVFLRSAATAFRTRRAERPPKRKR